MRCPARPAAPGPGGQSDHNGIVQKNGPWVKDYIRLTGALPPPAEDGLSAMYLKSLDSIFLLTRSQGLDNIPLLEIFSGESRAGVAQSVEQLICNQ